MEEEYESRIPWFKVEKKVAILRRLMAGGRNLIALMQPLLIAVLMKS